MKVAAAVALMIACTVAANLLLKTGAAAYAAGTEALSRAVIWPVFLGVASFGAAAVVYMLILTWLPLSIAQAFASAQFIAVIVAARLFLAEPISGTQWAGISLIAAGIAIIGWSQR